MNRSKLRKGILAAIMFIVVFATAGCGGNKDDNSSEGNTDKVDQTATIGEYFPYTPDTIAYYEGSGSEFAQKDVSVDYISGDRIQLRTNNGGTEAVSILEKKQGELRLQYTRAECYYRADLTSVTGAKPEILLKEPLIKGTSWTLTDGSKRTITAVDQELSTPAGTYKTIEVTTAGKNDTQHDYYAKGIGLVKTEVDTGDMVVSSTLKKLGKNIPFVQTMRFFHPYFMKDTVAYVEEKISLHTNDDVKEELQSNMKKSYGNDLSAVIGKNVTLNSIKIDQVKNQVKVDFSKNLVTEMNAGTELEGMIIDSIADTIGSYYGVNDVEITLDGEPYSSGHIAMGKGETFEVRTDKAIQYEK